GSDPHARHDMAPFRAGSVSDAECAPVAYASGSAIHLPRTTSERTIPVRDSSAVPSEDSPVAFRCPYCQFRIATKAPPKPGKYTPNCPKCKAKIALTVPSDSDSEWVPDKIPGQQASTAESSRPTSAEAADEANAFGQSVVGESTEATGEAGQPLPAADGRTVSH